MAKSIEFAEIDHPCFARYGNMNWYRINQVSYILRIPTIYGLVCTISNHNLKIIRYLILDSLLIVS